MVAQLWRPLVFLRSLLLASAVLALAGCPQGEGQACELDSDCGGDMICCNKDSQSGVLVVDAAALDGSSNDAGTTVRSVYSDRTLGICLSEPVCTARSVRDAGTPVDASPPDAPMSVDSGPDASDGAELDASQETDAAMPTDAGDLVDAAG
jgi:hypothetical protein